MAARAHDVAAIALRGRTACLNFADSAWRLPVPASSEAKDIQKAAAEAAEAFRPSEAKDIKKAAAEAAEAFRPSKNDNVAESTSSETLMELQHYRHAAYMDEEAIFETPEYGYSMAEAMMLPAPQFLQSERNDDTDAVTDLSLWIYELDLPIPK